MNDYNKCGDCLKVDEITSILRTVAPEMVSVLEERYNILKVVSYLQPIGRRGLSLKLNITERIIRKEANTLKDQGLLEFSLDGMRLTVQGESALRMLNMFFNDLRGIKGLEEKIAEKLKIRKVIIAPYSEEDEQLTLKEIGKVGAEYLSKILKDDSKIGITGGSSVHSIIEAYRKEKTPFANSLVIPARGGLGTITEYQANSLVEKLAMKTGSEYKMLYTPDFLSQTTINSLMDEPDIKEIVEILDQLDILVFGIGRSSRMAKRRSLKEEEIGTILKKGAVSEAFGYYFNQNGEIVHEISTIGIKLEKFKKMDNLIAVAGGVDKAEAIISICKLNPNLVLVTDERVARIIMNDL